MAVAIAPTGAGRVAGAWCPAKRGSSSECSVAPTMLVPARAPLVCPAGRTAAAAALVSAAAALGWLPRRGRGRLRMQQRLAGKKSAAKTTGVARKRAKVDAFEAESGGDFEKVLQERLERFRRKQEKKYGEGAVVSMDQDVMAVPTFSTGVLDVDLALGGGLPYGRIIEIYGPEMSGKTTLALSCMASVQKETGRHCFYIDAENAMSRDYAENMGVDTSLWELTYPESAEMACEMAIDAAECEAFKVIVIDSVAALTPLEEHEKSMHEYTMASLPRIMSKFMRKITNVLQETRTTLILINQLRANIGGYGPAEITTGGKAIPYFASVRMCIRSPKSGLIGKADAPTGIESTVTVTKNKLAAPHRKGQFQIIFNHGISWSSSVFKAALKHDVVRQAGAWYYFEDMKEKGSEKFIAKLEESPEALQRMEDQTRQRAFEKRGGVRKDEVVEEDEVEADEDW